MFYEEKVINGILHFRGTPTGEFVVTEGAVADVFNLLSALSDEQRLRVFRYFCVSCGNKNPRCHCSNEE